jgi:chromosome segregation ATPase
MLEKHKQHDIEEIDAAISAKKERIQAEVQDLQSRSENVNQLIDDLNSYEDGYKLDNAIVIKLVTAKGESLKELIDKRTTFSSSFTADMNRIGGIGLNSLISLNSKCCMSFSHST